MRGRGARRAAFIVLTLALLVAGAGAGAQQAPRREEISEELAALVRKRWEAIGRETAGSRAGEWAGVYRSFGGPTVTTHLAWSPASGFTVWWENCSRPLQALVNYGDAALTEGSLRLRPELPEGGRSAYPVPRELIPVRWGAQHFLIPRDRVINFAYAVNSKSAEEVESFLLKVEDYDKERGGLPDLPRAYGKYLGAKPIKAKASRLGPDSPGRYRSVVLNVGRAEGVVPEMKFYLSSPRNVYVQLQVTDVREHESEAFVVRAAFADGREGEVEPKAGWRFTSRAPADSSQYLP